MSTLVATEIEVAPLLPRTSLRLAAGEVLVARGAPGPQLTALALALAGRLPLSGGTVALESAPYAGDLVLQRSVALVDVPTVSEPDPGVPLRTVVAEELAMAGKRYREFSGAAARRWLEAQGLGAYARRAVRELPGPDRVALFAELARYRPGTKHLVLAAPERLGVPVDVWLPLARGFADEGYGVLVTVSTAVAGALGESVLIGGVLEETTA